MGAMELVKYLGYRWRVLGWSTGKRGRLVGVSWSGVRSWCLLGFPKGSYIGVRYKDWYEYI